MPLSPGTRLGTYEITSLIGVGGMGEVYQATDITLGRQVAIKVLPAEVAQDSERLARFDREARTLASLNHPNIAQIYGLEDSGGVKALVMELVEGPTLAEVMAQGPMALDVALAVAAQIAAAIDAAHEQNIVHRDLKPANVKLRADGTAKVLDFGLAKAMEATARPAGVASDQRHALALSQSPTITSPAVTRLGVILGTAAYMAPEQASGRPVDKRADIWAFGVVLWEMLTGRQLFEGETISHVIAGVLTRDPDLAAVPPRVRPLLSRCLEKDPRKRLRDIGDAMSLVAESAVAITGTDLPPAAQRRSWVSTGGWIAAALLAVTLAAVALMRPSDGASTDPPAVRFQIERADDVYNRTDFGFAVSPDGTMLAYYRAGDSGRPALVVRTLATSETREIPIAAANASPQRNSFFWSPDGRQLVVGAGQGGQVFDLSSGATRELCGCRYVGGTWGRDGTILLGAFGTGTGSEGGLSRLPPGSSTPVPVTTVDASRGERDISPAFFPDGRRFLFTRVSRDGTATYVGSLDGSAPTRIADGSRHLFVPAATGRSAYLLGIEAAGLVAQPFDPDRAQVTGPPVTIVAGAVTASASEGGVLATSGAGTRPLTVPTWFDRVGSARGTVGDPGPLEAIALSSDGRRLAVGVADLGPGGSGSQVWLQDLPSGARTRLTFNRGSTPVWSPDGARLAYTSPRNGLNLPYQKASDGTGEERPLFDYDFHAWTNDWSHDGRWIVFSSPGRTRAGNDLWVVRMDGEGDRQPVPYLNSPALEQQAQFSPDGRFIAYGSDQSGAWEIYVQPFPDASGGKWLVSNGGGVEPRWNRDGTELFYFSGQTLMAVPIRLQPTFSSGAPARLFDAPILPGYTADSHRWQVAPDGRRFLLLATTGRSQGTPLDVVVNWPALLEQ